MYPEQFPAQEEFTVARPLVAIVGRPNVGKSTLFNRLVGQRLAIVEDTPGTTRDRLVAVADWGGREFDVVDTGGLSLGDAPAIDVAIRNQVEVAIEQADVVVFVVDAYEGITSQDRDAADLLRRSGRPVVVAANKSESEGRRQQGIEFWELALGEPIAISGLHGTGTGDMLEAVIRLLPERALGIDDDGLAVAIVGRPNVGKSSIVNRLLGSERVLVSEVPGTTRDAIDTPLKYGGRNIILVDTAGIRRRGRVEPGIEKYSVLRAMRALARADVAVLVLDATEGDTAQDAHLAGAVADAGVGAVIAVNKWDLVDKEEHSTKDMELAVRTRIKFLDFAPIVSVSALTGQRVTRLLEQALEIDQSRHERVGTADLNRLVADVQARHNPPSKFGKRLRIYYAAQVAEAPPTFVFFVNDTRLVHFTYERFVENQLRRKYPYLGTPVRLIFRARDGEEATASRSRGSPQKRSR